MSIYDNAQRGMWDAPYTGTLPPLRPRGSGPVFAGGGIPGAMSPRSALADPYAGPSSWSESGSGERLSAEQQARLGQLYPMLLQQWQNLAGGGGLPPVGGPGQYLASAGGAAQGGGTPYDFGPPVAYGQPFNFGPAADFGRPYDFGVGRSVGAAPVDYPDITIRGVIDDQLLKETINADWGKAETRLGTQQGNLANRLAPLGGAMSPLYQSLLANSEAIGRAGAADRELESRRWAAEKNAQHLLNTQQAAVERARALGDERLRYIALASQDDLQRRSLAGTDELTRLRLAAAARLQHGQLAADEGFRREQGTVESRLRQQQLAADEGFRRRQLGIDEDIRRRELTSQARGQDVTREAAARAAQASRENALLSGMLATLQPERYSYARSQQNSNQSFGGGAAASRSTFGSGSQSRGHSLWG